MTGAEQVESDFFGTPGVCGVCKAENVKTSVLLEDDGFHGCYACHSCWTEAMKRRYGRGR